MFDITYLYLVAPIIGVTSALTSMFPKLLGSVKPIVAVVVAVGMYYAARNLEPALFGLLIATGSAMGLYALADKAGETKIKVTQ